MIDVSARRPATTTQFAETSSGTSYAAQNCRGVGQAGVDRRDEAVQPRPDNRGLTGRPGVRDGHGRLPIQRAEDVHQGRILVRLTVADSEDARLSDYVRLRETVGKHLPALRDVGDAEPDDLVGRRRSRFVSPSASHRTVPRAGLISPLIVRSSVVFRSPSVR